MAKFRIVTELATLALCNFGLFWPLYRFSDSRTTPRHPILQTCTSSFSTHTKVGIELLQLEKFPILVEKSTVGQRADKSQICQKFAIPTQNSSFGHRLTLAGCWNVSLSPKLWFCTFDFGKFLILCLFCWCLRRPQRAILVGSAHSVTEKILLGLQSGIFWMKVVPYTVGKRFCYFVAKKFAVWTRFRDFGPRRRPKLALRVGQSADSS